MLQLMRVFDVRIIVTVTDRLLLAEITTFVGHNSKITNCRKLLTVTRVIRFHTLQEDRVFRMIISSFILYLNLQILALICCSRSGLAEAELMDVLSLQWLEWEPLIKCLIYDRPILHEVNDLICVSHEQVRTVFSTSTDNDARSVLGNVHFDEIL